MKLPLFCIHSDTTSLPQIAPLFDNLGTLWNGTQHKRTHSDCDSAYILTTELHTPVFTAPYNALTASPCCRKAPRQG